ncbi:hypothetical protein D3C73_1543720 [compost metagenome]
MCVGIGGSGDRLCGNILGQAIGQMRRIGQQHFFHARDAGGRLRHGLRTRARDQHMDRLAQLGASGNGVARGAVQDVVVVFGNN